MLVESAKPRSNAPAADARGRLQRLGADYRRIRRFTEHLTAPLTVEDCVVQTMEDVSPTKWHLAHTTWFFEVFVLQAFAADYRLFHPDYPYLFNSYYVQAGERHCRDRRGYISRPTLDEVVAYRQRIDEEMAAFIETADPDTAGEAARVLEIGLHHEQQHQELILTDIKHVLSVNPLRPIYKELGEIRGGQSKKLGEIRGRESREIGEIRDGDYQEIGENGGTDYKETGKNRGAETPLEWVAFDEGVYEIGHDGDGFAYDNEGPRHKHFLRDFLLASRPVTNGEFMAFMDDGGYERPELWLSMGWAAVDENRWSEPFYWERIDGEWWIYTLGGMKRVDPNEPAVHVSYFEADAYARWSGARLPIEEEWEVAALTCPVEGHFVEDDYVHPRPARTVTAGTSKPDRAERDSRHNHRAGTADLTQMYGDVWEWTRSQYSPYPGYYPPEGALGEYNGKFMCNQFVLRGGSCATSETHIRPTYRNFFPPEATWQFTGFRLARDL